MAFWKRKRQKQEAEEAAMLEEQMLKAQEEFDRRREQKRQERDKKEKEEKEAAIAKQKAQEKKNKVSVEKILAELEEEEWVPGNAEDSKRIVRDCCEAIREIESQRDAAKGEYDKVSSRLMDIQHIEQIKGEERDDLLATCKRIMYLSQERNQYKNRHLTITDAQIRYFDPYEDALSQEVKKMYDGEMYQMAIEGDIEKLEEEKRNLHKQQKQIVENQRALKKMAKILIALIVSLFVLFVVIYYALETDMTYPYMGTILLAAISATVIFAEANRNRVNATLTGRKINKAIGLLNRVKIKYINNRSLLDYNCEKFHVENAADFEKKWIEYRKAKEYERKFQENAKQLQLAENQLIDMLNEHRVAEPNIWVNQTIAILDSREMVEIRHALNVRRGKLRERISYNESARTTMVEKIDRIMAETQGASKDIVAIVQSYHN
ncbi:MAG: hypothetical protein J1E62_04610 [Lachnospiraceae bacterium]|nr:hypothetical protein [Lachnospiraceae bacterium]